VNPETSREPMGVTERMIFRPLLLVDLVFIGVVEARVFRWPDSVTRESGCLGFAQK
jgi:hypothetical protein